MSWDPRQLAMLKEIGVLPWEPRDASPADEGHPQAPAVEAAPAEVPAQPRQAAAPAIPAAPAVARQTANQEPPRTTADPASVAPVAVHARRPTGVEQMDWPALREAVAGCQACKLCNGRRNTVFGVGHEQADWMIVGEAPGEQEDLKGEPFVGQAGKLLDNMLRSLALTRSEAPSTHQVFIANVLKCRPPHNRNPEPEEVAQCEPFLQRQVELVQPKIIVAMGRFAVQSLLRTGEPIGRLRGRVHRYHGVPVIVTYHPAYLLRNLPDKAKAWEDLCLAADTAAAASAG